MSKITFAPSSFNYVPLKDTAIAKAPRTRPHAPASSSTQRKVPKAAQKVKRPKCIKKAKFLPRSCMKGSRKRARSGLKFSHRTKNGVRFALGSKMPEKAIANALSEIEK